MLLMVTLNGLVARIVDATAVTNIGSPSRFMFAMELLIC